MSVPFVTTDALARASQNFLKKVLAFGWIIPYIKSSQADMAQLVEHNLAKVGVAGSSPVVRSKRNSPATTVAGLFCIHRMGSNPRGSER